MNFHFTAVSHPIFNKGRIVSKVVYFNDLEQNNLNSLLNASFCCQGNRKRAVCSRVPVIHTTSATVDDISNSHKHA